eukprot:INCI10687.1.p1 GENE.INCI10687.1~~INCI10687.1.p1  ORF type:complete len:375 (-),score=55.71 INCI10687.1:414-1538(-)
MRRQLQATWGRALRKRVPWVTSSCTTTASTTATSIRFSRLSLRDFSGLAGGNSSDFVATLANDYLFVTTCPQKGRQAVARCAIEAGTTVFECRPLAKVVKESGSALNNVAAGTKLCAHCFGPLVDAQSAPFCSESCLAAAWAEGEEILSRCDTGALVRLSRDEGRLFPLLVARILGRILCEFKTNGGDSPTAKNVANLCFANFAAQIRDELVPDYNVVRSTFVGSGIIRAGDFDQVFPPEWYFRTIGSLQLNAFELSVAAAEASQLADSTVLRATALLPGAASMFNHSCQPTLLVSTEQSSSTRFVAAEALNSGDELCISYIGVRGSSPTEGADKQPNGNDNERVYLDSPTQARQDFLLDKYGFTCTCPRCRAE